MTSTGALERTDVEGFAVSVDRAAVDPEWDSFLVATPGDYHVQSSLWCRVKQLNGWEHVRIKVRGKHGILGGAQMLFRSSRMLGRLGYVTKGPVMADDDDGLADVILTAVREIAAREGIRALVLQPPRYGAASRRLQQHGFAPFAVETAPSATVVLDLTSEEHEILARMSKGMRNGVRRSQRRGISTRVGTREDLPTFHALLQATSRRQGMSIYGLDYFLGMWDVLAPADAMVLFLSELGDEPVSAQICLTFGDSVIAKQIGWSGDYRHLHPNEALDWHTIRWAKERGFKHYDLEGITRGAAEALLETGSLPDRYMNTPTSYKVRLGGEPRLLPSASCFFTNPALRLLYGRIGKRVLARPRIQKAIGRFRTQ